VKLDGARVWALVPCHREPPRQELLDALAARVGRVLVVDDGMPVHAPAGERIETLRVGERPGGKGTAIAAGIARALEHDVAAIIVVDGDDQHPPDVIGEFLAASGRAELVIGDRFADRAGMPSHRRLANSLASALLAATTWRRVRDSQCGMRLLRGRALTDIPFPRGGYESETRHLKACLRAGIAVSWVPIPALYRGERSSFRPVRDGLRVLWAAIGPINRQVK
jgi:glycosyltransferase involved in cell wall biosynthesis